MIYAVVPLKSVSVRVPNKNFKDFGDTTLAKIKINNLLKTKNIDGIIINSESEKVLDLMKKTYSENVEYVLREPYYAKSECSGSVFFENIAKNCVGETIIYSPVTSPFVTPKILENAIEKYKTLEEYDSVVSVSDIKHHMWLNNRPLNYDPYHSPNSQNLPEIQKITYGFGIISKELMINKRNIIGNNPLFYKLNEIEAIDIDTELDFKFAEYVYMNNKNRK